MPSQVGCAIPSPVILHTVFILSLLLPSFQAGVSRCVACTNYAAPFQGGYYDDVPVPNQIQADCGSADASQLLKYRTNCDGLAAGYTNGGPNMRCQVAFWNEGTQTRVFRGCIDIGDPTYGTGHVDGQCKVNPLINTPSCICNVDGCNDYSNFKTVGGSMVGIGGSSADTQVKLDASGNVVASARGSASTNGTASASGSASATGSATGGNAAATGSNAGAGTAADGSNSGGGSGTDLAADSSASAAADLAARAAAVNNGTAGGSASSNSGVARQATPGPRARSFSLALLVVTFLGSSL